MWLSAEASRGVGICHGRFRRNVFRREKKAVSVSPSIAAASEQGRQLAQVWHIGGWPPGERGAAGPSICPTALTSSLGGSNLSGFGRGKEKKKLPNSQVSWGPGGCRRCKLLSRHARLVLSPSHHPNTGLLGRTIGKKISKAVPTSVRCRDVVN